VLEVAAGLGFDARGADFECGERIVDVAGRDEAEGIDFGFVVILDGRVDA
jgi:hypothetical protein